MPPPGAPGRLRWRHEASALPAHLLVRRDGVLGVMVADGERARFVLLPGAREGRSVSVRLPPQTLIITRGRHGLADGDEITVP